MRALAALAAAFASFVTMDLLCRAYGAQLSPAILAAILAISLVRRSAPRSARQRLAAPFVIAATALAATGVAWMLHANPLGGAVVFSAAIAGSIKLRDFGERGRRAGALVALPLVTMLVVPARAAAPGGALVDFGLIVAAGVVPLAYAIVVGEIAQRARVPLAAAEAQPAATPRTAGFSNPTRMALQMAAALSAAFSLGFGLFPGHWGWVVFSAFIVCSGARGRGDAAYMGVLRVVGSLVGTLAAAALAYLWAPGGVAEATAIFGLLFFALWLRDVNYAYWAGFVTLILAFLTRSNNGLDSELLGVRLAAIFAGAACAVAAAWFVLPIRTEAVVRRRLADALTALDDLVAHAGVADAEQTNRQAYLEGRIAELASVAPPVIWHRRLFAFRAGPEHPARWIELTNGLREHAAAFIAPANLRERQCGIVRRAIGAARRALASHGKPDAPADALPVSVALRKLREALTIL